MQVQDGGTSVNLEPLGTLTCWALHCPAPDTQLEQESSFCLINSPLRSWDCLLLSVTWSILTVTISYVMGLLYGWYEIISIIVTSIPLKTKICIVKAMIFFPSYVRMWQLDHKEGWAPKNWCFQTVVPEKTLESPLDSKGIEPINTKGNQPWIFIGRTDAEAEALILWPPDSKSWLTGKDPDAGKDWRQEEKGTTEDEMVGWHHWLDEHEFEWAPRDSERQGSLASCSPWGHKESDTTEQLNNKQLAYHVNTNF